jgi:hypothetical protein
VVADGGHAHEPGAPRAAIVLQDGSVLLVGGHTTGAFQFVGTAERYYPNGAPSLKRCGPRAGRSGRAAHRIGCRLTPAALDRLLAALDRRLVTTGS